MIPYLWALLALAIIQLTLGCAVGRLLKRRREELVQ